MGPRFRVSSERLGKPGIEPKTPGLDGLTATPKIYSEKQLKEIKISFDFFFVSYRTTNMRFSEMKNKVYDTVPRQR